MKDTKVTSRAIDPPESKVADFLTSRPVVMLRFSVVIHDGLSPTIQIFRIQGANFSILRSAYFSLSKVGFTSKSVINTASIGFCGFAHDCISEIFTLCG